MAASSSAFPSPSRSLFRHPLSSPTTWPPADDPAFTWILEFILRQPIPDYLAHDIFLSLPFSSSDLQPHLRKTLLLRRISSDIRRRSLSERTLHSLELIVELDRHRGVSPSDRLKAAYCAAAVECTAVALRRSGSDFVDAVQRIWMQEAVGDLVSEPLLQWRTRMERCLSSGEGGEEILRRNMEDAIRMVKDYLEEALEEMGPSFLEIAAAQFVEKRIDIDAVHDKAGKGVSEVNASLEKLDKNDGEFEDDGGSVSMEIMKEGGAQEQSEETTDTSGTDLVAGEFRAESHGLGEAPEKQGGDFQVESGSHSVEVEIENERAENAGGDDIHDQRRCKIHEVDPGEVRKVKIALKKSCFDLRMTVEDPLPEAQVVAAAVLASLSQDHALLKEKAAQGSVEDPTLLVSPVELVAGIPTGLDSRNGDMEKEKFNVNRSSSELKEMEGNGILNAINKEAEPSRRSDNGACRSLFERNPTAHTSEWSDDSLESPLSMEELQLLNPMKKRISPTRLDKGKHFKRRVVKRWTSQEELTLREAVAKYGKGNWKLILNHYSKIFEERTEVDLKDKWRNMTRHRQ